jgi:hypothetical protein
LETLTELKPRGGESGALIAGQLNRRGVDQLLGTNTFRPTLSAAVGIQDVWPLLLLIGSVAFFADVFVRRVAVSFEWVGAGLRALSARLSGRENNQSQVSISRLQSRKMEIEKEIESRRAATRFEPESDPENTKTVSGKRQLDDVLASEMEKTPALPPKIQRDDLDADPETSYTTRLLDAKRKSREARKDQRRDNEP